MITPHIPIERLSMSDRLALLGPAEVKRRLGALAEDELARLEYDWAFWARSAQLLPPGDWTVWLLMGGRGSGKTRPGAETIIEWAKDNDRMGLVGRTAADARDVMIKGESGILACSPPWFMPDYEPSKRLLTWPNGSTATVYTAEEPDLLRGPQHKKMWWDEVASWQYDEEAVDNALLGLRIGELPQTVVTTTPKPTKLMRRLVKDPTAVISRMSTYENLHNLAPAFRSRILARYAGTVLEQQEIMGLLLDDIPGALWKREWIDRWRVRRDDFWKTTEQGAIAVDATGRPIPVLDIIRMVVAIDPAATDAEGSDDTGIVVACLASNGHAYVLEDITVHADPGTWADVAIGAYQRHRADLVIGEVNNGGDMVQHTIVTAPGGHLVAYADVHASRGKATRAQPISVLYKRGLVHHVGLLAELEDQLCTWVPGLDPKSPDRLDAVVWALTALFFPEEETTEVHSDPDEDRVNISAI